MMLDITLQVARFDLDLDTETSLQDYFLQMEEQRMVLDALLEIRDLQDGSLAFRHSCRSGICGSCAVMINGQPKLACQTKLAEVAEDGLIRLEPLAGFRVLRDLVVDIDPFLESLKAVVPWLVLRPGYHGRMSPEDDGPPSRAGLLAALVFVILLVGAGVWIAQALIEGVRQQNCVMSGRRDCLQVDPR